MSVIKKLVFFLKNTIVTVHTTGAITIYPNRCAIVSVNRKYKIRFICPGCYLCQTNNCKHDGFYTK